MNTRNIRGLSELDLWLGAVDTTLRTLAGVYQSARPSPAVNGSVTGLTPDEMRLSAALMRVNHVGEVCAQALYSAQAITTRSPELRIHLEAAAKEEADHLAWTHQRLRELDSRPSLLNPLWYAGAFAFGTIAGRFGDRVSLGFVAETETQVERHLASHLTRLPTQDSASRAIVEQMREDEARHGEEAGQRGAAALPRAVTGAMRLAAKVMTTTAHYI